MKTEVDWSFTEDGDLDLGAPKLNDEGIKLYKHADGSIDTQKGQDGREIRDIALSYSLQAEKTIILNRLKTDTPDWFHHPNMGANLSDLVGEPNTRETGLRGAAMITAALTYDNLYETNQLGVRPIPVSANEIIFMITITKYREKPYQLPIIFSLDHGQFRIYTQ